MVNQAETEGGRSGYTRLRGEGGRRRGRGEGWMEVGGRGEQMEMTDCTVSVFDPQRGATLLWK